MASSPNLNLSGEVKGHVQGTHFKYPKSANYHTFPLHFLPNFFVKQDFSVIFLIIVQSWLSLIRYQQQLAGHIQVQYRTIQVCTLLPAKYTHASSLIFWLTSHIACIYYHCKTNLLWTELCRFFRPLALGSMDEKRLIHVTDFQIIVLPKINNNVNCFPIAAIKTTAIFWVTNN